MKLKKIVSLALAGVMAVSMLAGCATKNDSNSNSGATQTTTTSNVVTLFQNALKSYDPDLKITVKDNAQLTSAIKTNDFMKNLSYGSVDSTMTLIKGLVAGQFGGASEATSFADVASASAKFNFSDYTGAMLVGSSNTSDSVYYGAVFMDGEIAGTTMLNKAANEFAQAVKDAKIKNAYEDVKGEDYTAAYTVSLYSADYTDASVAGKTGTLLIMVVETDVEKAE